VTDETRLGIMVAVRALLMGAGENPDREGLRETPERIAKAYAEWFSGYSQDPSLLFKTFVDGAERCNEMILVSNITVTSWCEHHMALIWGVAHIAYIPNGKILGLSKFARLVDIFARRLQVQERLTNQVADCLQDNLSPKGIGVMLECRHACMETRGIKARGCVTTTSALRGILKEAPEARAEFLALVRSASKASSGI
jgi:GTP cyclohydrolase I